MKWEDCLDKNIHLAFQLEGITQLKGLPKAPETNLQISEQDLDLSNLNLKEFKAKIVKKTALNENILEIKIDMTELEWEPKSGDSFGVNCPVPATLVDKLMLRLKYNDTKITTDSKQDHLKGTRLVSEFLSSVDIFEYPKKSFFRLLGEYTFDQKEKKELFYLSSTVGGALYKSLKLEYPNLLDILKLFPTCSPPLTAILQHLPPLKPRYYSISESPLKTGKNEITFAFNLVRDLEKKYLGVCTSYLNSKSVGDCISVFPRVAPIPFNMVDLKQDKLILIANGTGIAPFVGFLQDLQDYKNVTVVYGHRTDKDGIYNLPELCKNTTLIECLSRQESKYKYVQDCIPALELQNSVIYVCGSGPMGKGVHDALIKYYADKDSLSMMQAIEYVNTLVKEGKYHRELW
ncbi:hypothetical protein HDV01_002258 [Terramyces sp. JEL0728]|nr:hypothetical protein HDV01_002258 [Terramyces sp. JEL0728]